MKGRFQVGDFLAFLYALVLVRQAFWLLPEMLAWGASLGVAALLGFLRVRSRPAQPRLPAVFWYVTAAPLGVYWALHLAYPDLSFDTLNYHILHGERAIRGLLAIPGDFYPYYFPFLNLAPDLLTGLLRAFLGYRLGTIGSCLVLVWTAAILFRILRRAIGSPVVCALAALWIVSSEGILWEVGNYMVDLFGLPLLLEAALLVLPGEESEGQEPRDMLADLPLLGLLLGSAVAFKLTNLPFAAAIGLVFLGRLVVVPSPRRDPRRAALSWALGVVAFLLPMLPHTFLLWWTTGSPVFPHYNSLFGSPLFPSFNIGDGRFGPTSRLQSFVWPVLSVFQPERLSEMGATSGRIALGFLGSVAALLIRPRSRLLPGFAAIVVVGSILWSFGSGNHRYGLFAELSGGLVLALLAARCLDAASGEGRAVKLLAWLPVALLGAQSLVGLRLALRSDWSGRPTALYEPRIALRDLRRLGSDRDLGLELPAGLRNALPAFAGWVDVSQKTNGLMALLAPRLPMIGLRLGSLFDMPANQARFQEALRATRGRPLLSLAFIGDLESAKAELLRRGFLVRRETRYLLPFFSDHMIHDIVALELEAPPARAGPDGSKGGALPAAGGLRRPPVSPGGGREDPELIGSIDDPAEGAEVRGTLVVRGWARIPGEDLAVQVLLDGVERKPDEFRRTARSDVSAALPRLGSCAAAGYEARLALEPGDEGPHELSVVFRTRDGRVRHYPGRRITAIEVRRP